MHFKPVTVSIVSHGQLELILPLLDQLNRLSAPCIEKVVLTVNIPEPDLLAQLTWNFALQRIDNITPKGFGTNHNAAFKHCESEWFLVLNPDMRFNTDVLTPLIAQTATDCGLMTPRILEPGKSEPEQHRAIITPLEILTRKCAGYVRPIVPAWIPGLFMLFYARAYAQIGGFDERFFMYGEDFDICARARLAGWKLQVAEDLVALHEARRASHSSARHLYWHVRSLLQVWMSATFWRYQNLSHQ
jgi:N-acetylglucosaminyl-diphospho-decaprenol L-rhamnosyltransferase